MIILNIIKKLFRITIGITIVRFKSNMKDCIINEPEITKKQEVEFHQDENKEDEELFYNLDGNKDGIHNIK